ncbi:MAG TPA: DinB family protein [Terriglobales bacterium]|nr:DinB family protein [Terriglobales bacterium]
MRKLLALALVCAAVVPALAQEKNPVTSAIREILPRQQKNIVAAAEEMPADKFSYKPTTDQMIFGKLVLHIAEGNNMFCSKIAGSAPPKSPQLKETDSKDKLLAGLKSSFDFCDSALSKMDDSKLGEKTEVFGGREASMAWVMIALSNSWADHYGMQAMYLRLNGLLPPTAKKK